MNKIEKNLRSQEKKLTKLQARRKELVQSLADANTELEVARALFGAQAIDASADVGELSGELSKKQHGVDIYEQALIAIDQQITIQQEKVDEAAHNYYQDKSTALVNQIVDDSVQIIQELAKLQVLTHQNISRSNRVHYLRSEYKVMNALHNINFEEVARSLQNCQSILEKEARVKLASDVPNAMSRGGFLDNETKQRTLGSAVRDWAAAQVKS